MKCVYFDCASGISGDMLLGALLDAGIPQGAVAERLDSLGIPGLRLEAEAVKRHGFRGTRIHIRHEPERAHRHLKDILELLHRSGLTERQRTLAERVFRRLAEAEAKVHGSRVESVHFHEVGAVDSIADIVGACVAWDLMQADRGVASAVAVGGGFVQIAHGRCSVPAPATAELLRGCPVLAGPFDAELTTPTGAALLTCLAQSFDGLPEMTIETVGYGAGSNDFPTHANLLRVIVGTLSTVSAADRPVQSDQVLCLETNLDDCSGQVVADCFQRLLHAGALDVFTVPIMMKKGRPGIMLSVLCEPAQQAALEEIMFRSTSTIGIRGWLVRRSKLPRRSVVVQTDFGLLPGKQVTLPDGSERTSLEYEAARACAESRGLCLDEVLRSVTAASVVSEGTPPKYLGPPPALGEGSTP